MKEMHPSVPSEVARWVLEPLSLYNLYSGVTNNQSEGLNRVKRIFSPGEKHLWIPCVSFVPTSSLLNQ